MADYIYLLETRLSLAQQRAIGTIRAIARESDLTVFLTGGAVRDLTGGASVRDLDFTLQGNVLPLRQALESAGAVIAGEHTGAQRLFLTLPGSVRVEIASAMRLTYPQASRPEYQPSNITDDLRSRDFTANAMAISLNEGSYGLLMDPLNGVADIENREIRLVSNYGFIEDPSRLIRAARLMSRLGWQMEERTRQRYETAKEENYISSLTPWNRGYELEELFQEEDPLRILRALEGEGWSAHLFPALNSSKANATGLAELADRQGQLQIHGIYAQSAVLVFPLLTAKLSAGEIATLKHLLVRPGFAAEIDALEGRVREFAARLSGKEAAIPSAVWKLLHESEPNLVLALLATSKAPSVQGRLKTFLNDSPSARQRIPYTLLQEMRITPDLAEYSELLEKLFFELMDGKLATVEEMKAFLEPYSPPAPPPPVNLRRAKAKKEARSSRSKAKKSAEPDVLPETVAEAQEAAGITTGMFEPGDLTGPDRGPEPTPVVPLASKVAPGPIHVAELSDTESAKPDAMELAPAAQHKAAAPKMKEPGKQAASAKRPASSSAPAKADSEAAPVSGTSSEPKKQVREDRRATLVQKKDLDKNIPAKTPVKNPAKSAEPKTATPTTAASVKTAAPVKAAVSVKASAPVKTAASAKAAVPVKAAALVKTGSPVKTAIPAKGPAKSSAAETTLKGGKTPAQESKAPSAKKTSPAKKIFAKTAAPAKKAIGPKKTSTPSAAARTASAAKKSAPPGKAPAKAKKDLPAKKSTTANKAPAKSGTKKTAGRKR